ncbi:MAG: hypothetical protein K0R25_1275 [Rickettsiaceae bacterium]|jgi:hypothetical protein|nr:hypothetical protein [Rickettsiaceae bacterium]
MKIFFFTIFLVFASQAAAQELPELETVPAQAAPQMVPDENGNAKKIVEDDKGVFSVILENDLFTGTDRAYTNGVRFSYTSSEQGMPRFIRHASSYLPLLNPEGKKRISIAAGQNMFTPSDITKSQFLDDDFHYAGWLYGSLGIISDSGSVLDSAVLTAGVIGPSAKAEQTQKYIHKIVNSPQPKGWHNQIKDQAGINFSYERKWREIFASNLFGAGFDVIPHAGINLGNVNTNILTGATIRLGYDLPSDYGPPRIRPTLSGSDFFIPTQKLSGYLFSTIEVRAVARDIFLDADTKTHSNSLDKKIIVGNWQSGATLTYKDARLSYTHVVFTRQFQGQKEKYTQFGGVTLSYRF